MDLMAGVEDVNQKVNKTIKKKKNNTLKKHFKTKETIDLCEMMDKTCLLYTSPSPRDLSTSRMPSSA